jgi:hypothetical protein
MLLLLLMMMMMMMMMMMIAAAATLHAEHSCTLHHTAAAGKGTKGRRLQTRSSGCGSNKTKARNHQQQKRMDVDA